MSGQDRGCTARPMVRGSLPLITQLQTNAGLRQRPAAHPAHHRARALIYIGAKGRSLDPDGGILAYRTIARDDGPCGACCHVGRSLLIS